MSNILYSKLFYFINETYFFNVCLKKQLGRFLLVISLFDIDTIAFVVSWSLVGNCFNVTIVLFCYHDFELFEYV